MKLKNIYPICVSIKEASHKKQLSLVRKYPFIEIRLDAAIFSTSEVAMTVKAAQSCIITCRPASNIFKDVKPLYSESERQTLLEKAINSGADFIDIEFEAKPSFKKPLIALAKRKKSKVIISLHNFKLTPNLKQLESMIRSAKRQGADIVKIATFARKKSDIQNLIGLLSKYDNLICIGMGEHGTSLRIAAPILGAPFTFAAPTLGKETAKGQLPYSEIKRIYKKLGLIKV
jgi:3-dehydroquinate dehydratase-1